MWLYGKQEILKFSFYYTKCDFALFVDCIIKYINECKKSDVRLEENIFPNPTVEKFDFQIKNEHIHPLTKFFIALVDNNIKYFECHICEKTFEKIDVIK